MSVGTIPYQLRPNKAVDRQVFIDLLVRIHGVYSLSGYHYIGFGGPFLEDFKIVHAAFGITRLVSIEMDAEVHKRQLANRPLSCIACRCQTAGDFIATYAVPGNAIIWLDYAGKTQLKQLLEVQALLPKLQDRDVLKVTLNANPETLGRPAANSEESLDDYRFAVLRSRLGDFLPHDASDDELTRKLFPTLLLRCFRRACEAAMESRPDRVFELLTSFSYADSEHLMLTVTGMVLPKAERRTFLKSSRMTKWGLALRNPPEPLRIAVPNLCTRERLLLDSLLPRHGPKSILRRLKYLFEDDEDRTIRALESYVRFYRHYPYYSRIAP